MRIVIAGAGRGGLAVAAQLQQNGHSVTVIERDPLIARRVFDQYGIVALVGDATDPGLLAEGEAARADAVLAMLHRDADNLAVVSLARNLGAKRVMVRMREPEYRPVYVSAGVHQILSETEMLAFALGTAVEHDAVRHSMLLGNGESVAFEIEIPEDAWVVGQTVSAVASAKGFPQSCVIAGMAFERGGVDPARGSSVFVAGARLLVVARRTDLAQTIQFFRKPAPAGEVGS